MHLCFINLWILSIWSASFTETPSQKWEDRKNTNKNSLDHNKMHCNQTWKTKDAVDFVIFIFWMSMYIKNQYFHWSFLSQQYVKPSSKLPASSVISTISNIIRSYSCSSHSDLFNHSCLVTVFLNYEKERTRTAKISK